MHTFSINDLIHLNCFRHVVSNTSCQRLDRLYRCTIKYRKAAFKDFLMKNT